MVAGAPKNHLIFDGDINCIFDENNNFISNEDDYIIEEKKEENEFIKVNSENKLIKIIGGGNKIPVNPIGMIMRYVYYIK
jgi:hypothetical protein